MALKFYYEWTDEKEQDHLVEIHDSEWVGSSIEVIPTYEPFTIEFPSIDIIDDPVIATGAKLSFIYYGSETNIRNFFTSDIKRFKVLHYVDLSLFWSGYLNSEVYTEDYSSDGQTVGIEFEMYANDGMAILDRIYFYEDLPDDSTTTPLDTIKYCMDKMDLDISYIYYSSDIILVHPDGTPTIVSDILTNTIINTSNYINEDGDRESCRTALDSVLRLYRLRLKKENSNIYIHSINQKASYSNIVYTRVDLSTSNIVTGISVSNSVVPILDSYYKGTGQQLNYKTSFNEQIISIDTYKESEAMPNELSSEDKFLGDYTETTYLTSDKYQWSKREYLEHSDFFFLLDNSTDPITSYPVNIVVDQDIQTNISAGGTSEWVAAFENMEYKLFSNSYNQYFDATIAEVVMKSITTIPPMVIAERKNSLVIEASSLFQIDLDEYLNSSTTTTSGQGNQGNCLWCLLRSGDYFLKADISYRDETLTYPYLTLSWVQYVGGENEGYMFPLLYSMQPDVLVTSANIAGRWNQLFDYGSNKAQGTLFNEEISDLFGQLTVPLPPNVTNGEPFDLEFGVLNRMSYCYYFYDNNNSWVTFLGGNAPETVGNSFDIIFMKDLSIGFDNDTSGTKNEIVIEGDSSYKDKAGNIDLILGTSDGETSLQRGAYLLKIALQSDPSQYSILSPTWYNRNYFELDSVSIFKPEDAIVKTCVANRFQPMYEISCDLDYEYVNETTLISFSDISGVNFIFTGGTLDCYSNILSGTWTQIKGD